MTPTIAFLNPGAQTAPLREELLRAVTAVIDGGHFILGPNVAALEQEVAAFCGAAHGIGVNSGSDALTLALKALDIGPGDEVITSPFTYIAPAESIHQLGAKVVFADIDPRTFTLDAADVARRITSRTKALLPVHLFGQAAPLGDLLPLCERHGLSLVEDCAQAIGATWQGRGLAGIGRIGCLSFYPTKNLGAIGDAGAIVTDDPALAERAAELRNYGQRQRYEHVSLGLNSRLDEIQAALLRARLTWLREFTERRRAVATAYRAGIDHADVHLLAQPA
ncbi:MAG: DegT/DnrJ/EryC1/StrS family aminotransferase, partial [Verrucomicrobiota bacterium]